jgi:hypothetical protein
MEIKRLIQNKGFALPAYALTRLPAYTPPCHA